MSVGEVVCACGATPERDAFGNALPCMRCYFGAADQRPADRIAQLTAELERTKVDLADARASLAQVRHNLDEMIRVHDEVEADHDAERAAHERTKVELGAELREAREVAQRNATDSHHLRQSAISLSTERDAAIAREQAAQAEAAAIQLAVLARIEQGAEEWRAANDARGSSINDYYHVAMRSLFLRFPAGSALAERVRQLEVVAAKARVAMGKTYRAGADDDLRDALAALDAEGGA